MRNRRLLTIAVGTSSLLAVSGIAFAVVQSVDPTPAPQVVIPASSTQSPAHPSVTPEPGEGHHRGATAGSDDNSATHDVGDDNGGTSGSDDNPATHDVGDDNGDTSGTGSDDSTSGSGSSGSDDSGSHSGSGSDDSGSGGSGGGHGSDG